VVYSSCSFLTSALDGVSGQRRAPTALYPQERVPGTHSIGGWVGLGVGLDTSWGENPLPLLGIKRHVFENYKLILFTKCEHSTLVSRRNPL
jgi:hypothetical protein